MKFRCSVFIYVILICNLCCQLPVHAVALDHAILMVPQLSDDMYALSAVLMDADSGRGKRPVRMPAQQKYSPAFLHWRTAMVMITCRYLPMQLPSHR